MFGLNREGLFFSALFLCMGDVVWSGQGRCVGNLCSFQVLEDFQSAKDSCKEWGANLFTHGSDEETLSEVLRGLSGRFWVQSIDGTRGGNCPSVSETTGRAVEWEPCRDKLDGYVCQHNRDESCHALQTHRGEQLTYSVGSERIDSTTETVPQGAIAVKSGDKYPSSKHLCFSTTWQQAPWNCEVLGGGCEKQCNTTSGTCSCPPGFWLHPNNISCSPDLCARCAEGCQRTGDSYTCTCRTGYKLMKDGKGCVDVNECEGDPCRAEGQECVNKPGDYECVCQEGFEEEDGVCVNVSICPFCEHMDCQKISGIYQCVCREGFMVSPIDPTKCDPHCSERDCPAKCASNPELEMKDMHQCHCPDGYIQDIRNGTAICTDINECESQKMCDHVCENLFGGYRCLCREGFKLKGESRCVRLVDEDEDYGSGSASPYTSPPSVPASVQPAAVPSYIKTGSVLGITVFALLLALLLYFVVSTIAKRCGRFELSSIKSPDIDIFYLQQVTTETYKRLSFDKQIKNDSQRL